MEAQIKALLTLQNIDLALDTINRRKGALPSQIAALEETLERLEKQKETTKAAIEDQEALIESYQEKKKEATDLVKKHQEEQLNATDKNDYETISRAIALQELEVQLAQKNIKAAHQLIKEEKEKATQIRAEIKTKKEQVKIHKEGLDAIQAEVEEEEKKLQESRPKAIKKIPEDLYHTYENMRRHLTPPYVVTHVKEEACGGCFQCIPPQDQATIVEGKKIVQCEYCRRILAQVIEEEPKPKKKKK